MSLALENEVIAESQNVTNARIPPNILKLTERIDIIKAELANQKRSMDLVNVEIKTLDKLLSKFLKKHIKSMNVNKKPRKPCGFALPTKVTDELCEFMDKAKNTLISRTEVTKFLMLYISQNNLQNPANRKIIIPNDTLWKLLGEEARPHVITHFTIQKYINKHFIKV